MGMPEWLITPRGNFQTSGCTILRPIEAGLLTPTMLWVHASLMAQPALAAINFTVAEHRTVDIDRESFDRTEMGKVVSTAPD